MSIYMPHQNSTITSIPSGFRAVFVLLLLQTAVLRWLLAHGRADDASDVLARLAGPGVTVDYEIVVRQIRARGSAISSFFNW